jgi:ribonuclease P protein component
MISKDYRLKENEVKKVLKYWKPFFSYWLVLNYNKNKLKHNRFAIIISWKNVDSSVKRNFFRRRFYDMVTSYVIASDSKAIQETWNNIENGLLRTSQWQFQTDNSKLSIHYDLIFVLKKQTKLEKNNLESINWFDNDVKFLLKKMMNIKW